MPAIVKPATVTSYLTEAVVKEIIASKIVPEGALQLICGSANGVAMAANKHKGVRAAIAWLEEIAALARLHNNANVLCLPSRFISYEEAEKITDRFLHESFEGGRHERRVNKIATLSC